MVISGGVMFTYALILVSVDIFYLLEMKIAIHDDCQIIFKELKFGKKHRYLIFRIEKERIVPDLIGERQENWDQFLHKLPSDDYRFCVYDLEFKTNDGINTSKIVFITWQPDNAKIKAKMLYATGKESFKAYLDLNGKEITISTIDQKNEKQAILEFNK